MQKGKATKKPVEVDWFKWEGKALPLEHWHSGLNANAFTEDFEINPIDEQILHIKGIEESVILVPKDYMIVYDLVTNQFNAYSFTTFMKTFNIKDL